MLDSLLTTRFVLFTLVLARTTALVMTAPILGSLAVPRQARALIAVAMSLLIVPVQLHASLPPVDNLVGLARLVLNEVLVGLLLGLGVTILFSGIQVAGQIVSQMSGLSLADLFSPGFDEDVSIFSQLFYFLTLAVFVAVGGHRVVVGALLDTFVWAPPGSASLGMTFVEVLTSIATESFDLGIRAAAPLLIALLLATLILGLISRTLPQINIIAVGFGINSLLTLALLFVTMGAIAWTFQEPAAAIIHRLEESLRPSVELGPALSQ
jgi:flagellar biosynthetic protein FliR